MPTGTAALVEQLCVAHSRANADLILARLLDGTYAVSSLFDCLEHDDIRVFQRACMVIADLGRIRPAWVYPYNKVLLAASREPRHVAIRRAATRLFSETPLEIFDAAGLDGPVLDFSFARLEDPAEKVTVRVFSMQTVANFCERYPELKGELRAAIEGELAEAEPGFRSRGRKILRALG